MKKTYKIGTLFASIVLASSAYSDVSCTISNSSIWSSGYQLDVSVTNSGDIPISNWSVSLAFDEPANVTNSWNATLTGTTTLTASDAGWNGSLSPGQSTSFGFQGAHYGSFAPPVCTGLGTDSSSSSSSSSSSTSTSSTSSTSSGGPTVERSVTTSICPDESDGEVVSLDSEGFPLLNPDDYEGSVVYFKTFNIDGAPIVTSSTTITYSNGSDSTRQMRMQLRNNPSAVLPTIDFPSTGSWETWDTVTLDQAYTGEINLVSVSPEGGPDVKSIKAVINLNCNSSICGWVGPYIASCPETTSSSSSSSSSSTSSSSSSSGGCTVATGGQSGNFNTTGSYCFRVQDNIGGWGVSNFDGRDISVTVNGTGTAVTTAGAPLPPKSENDYYEFSSTAGDYSWASVYWW